LLNFVPLALKIDGGALAKLFPSRR
jgi:hypothetical protein